MSIAASFYPSNRQWLLGMLEAALGGGMISGPFFGTILYSIGGYVFMLVAFGIAFILLSLAVPFIIDKELDMFTDFESKPSN